MIFSELYSAYYNAVAAVLNEAVRKPITKKDLREIVSQSAFAESILNIEPAITEERWQLITNDGKPIINHTPDMPLTELQKRWIRAVLDDPRVRLFTDEIVLPDVKPLFTGEDIVIFDKYSDGDPFEDPKYIRNFRKMLDAIKNKYPIILTLTNKRGKVISKVVMPKYLEYSEKDDKFRLIGTGNRFGSTVNVARVIKCKPFTKNFTDKSQPDSDVCKRSVEFELINERNALERVLLHFAHFEKQAERLENDKYKVTITYDKYDETEIVIRILSFGPMVKVMAPQHFIELIKERLQKQKSCGQ